MSDSDCIECGACCFSYSDTYVAVTDADMLRMGELVGVAVAQVEGRTWLRMSEGRCAMLEVIDAAEGGGWACSIYSIRPQACRQLSRGSAPCLIERSEKRVRARRALRVLA